MTIFGATKSTLLTVTMLIAAGHLARAQAQSANTNAVINQGAAGAAASFFANRNPSFLWTGSFSYTQPASSTDRQHYRVLAKGDLDLRMIRRYTFKIVPQIDDLRTDDNELPSGFYTLRLVVTLPDVQSISRKQDHESPLTPEQRYITSTRPRVVHYIKGVGIKTDVDLTFDDLADLAKETVLYIQLTPIQQISVQYKSDGSVDEYNTKFAIPEPNVRSVVSAVKFIPILPASSEDLPLPSSLNQQDPVVVNLDQYVLNSKMIHQTLNKPTETVEEYARNHHLYYQNIDSPEFEQALDYQKQRLGVAAWQLNRTELSNLVTVREAKYQTVPETIDRGVARSLCTLMAITQPDNSPMLFSVRISWIQRCTMDPHSYLGFYKTIHTSSVQTAQSSGTQDDPLIYQLMANFAASHSDSVDVSGGTAGSLAQGLPWKALPVNLSGVLSVSQNDSYSVAKTGIVQGLTGLFQIPFSVDLPIHTYRSCLAVEPKNLYGGNENKTGLYICSGEKQNLKLTETYNYLFQNSYGNAAAGNQGLHAVFRGQRELSLFFRTAEHFVNVAKDNPTELKNIWRDSLNQYASPENATAPGVLTFSVYRANEVRQITSPSEVKAPNLLGYLRSIWNRRTLENQ